MGDSLIGPLRTETGGLRQADRERIFQVASLTGQIGAARKRGNTDTVQRLTAERADVVGKLRKRVSGTAFGGALNAALSPSRSGGIRRELGEIERRASLGGNAGQTYGRMVPGGNAASNRARGIGTNR
jgi:hypothetical protein